MREVLISLIRKERERQFNLPYVESDIRNSPNDWVAIASSYLVEEIRRGPVKPTRVNYEDCLIKTAAIILAALEHCDKMEAANHFQSEI